MGHSSAFASAHVFPGGHVDAQDGDLPDEGQPGRHEDGHAYRVAGVRECFEESGILLARPAAASLRSVDGAAEREEEGEKVEHGGGGDPPLLRLTEEERQRGRTGVHDGTIAFEAWVRDRGGELDTHNLIPFTRWLTPANLAKRYSTQMYLYFLPLAPTAAAAAAASSEKAVAEEGEEEEEEEGGLHFPTPDGGVEHTAASFKHASEWLDLALRREIVLFPPQFFLLSLIAGFLQPLPTSVRERQVLLRTQRQKLREWVERDGDPPWRDKCISPNPIKREKGKWLIMGMSDPGPEVESLGRKGDRERVLRVELDKETERGRERPRPVEVCWRRDLFGEEGKGKGAKI